MRTPLIGYPSGWTLAVLDDPGVARRAAADLERSGIDAALVATIAGPNAAAQLARLGASTRRFARIRRSVQFMTMDQLPDLYVYERAVEDGRAVVGVKLGGDRATDAVALLRRHGAHFINAFGALMTAEIAPWRGPMPAIPQHMQR